MSRQVFYSRIAAAGLFAAACVANAQAPSAAPAPKRHATRPISSITVKIVYAEDYARKAKTADPTVTPDGKPATWLISSYDADSCVAWVSDGENAKGIAAAEVAAFKACRKVLDAR